MPTITRMQTRSGLPLVLTNNNQSQGLSRATVAEVYQQITKDIEESIILLGSYARSSRAQIDRKNS